MNTTGIASVLLLAGLLLPGLATSAQGEEPTGRNIEVYLRAEKAVQDFEDRPDGVEARHLHTPAVFGVDLNTGRSESRGGFWFMAQGAWLGYTTRPAWSAGLGPVLKLGNGILSVGPEIASNGSLGNELSNGYLKAWRWGLRGKFDITLPGGLRPSLEARLLYTPDVDIANFEKLATKIGRTFTTHFRPGVQFGLWIFQAEAVLSTYYLGTTAISSKQFAYKIPDQVVFKPIVGAGFDFGKLELWGRFSAVIPTRGDDSVEYLYMVPWYLDENLMTQNAVSLEVRVSL